MVASRLQSAMEYLMTYGWAILIIAVVLGALFGLGFFNSANLAPKVSAGACQVYRPEGPGTTSFINLEGTCNNELPQYVAQFNGASSYVRTGASGMPLGSSARSVFAWIYYTGNPNNQEQIFNYGVMTIGNDLEFEVTGSPRVGLNVKVVGQCWCSVAFPITNNTWHLVGFTYGSGATHMTFYIDGNSKIETSGGSVLNTEADANGTIGSFTIPNSNFWDGYIADVQVYNTSLSANEVTALYQEGIGGVPIAPQNLVGWWPLNGNANDYSGNLNNGVSTNVVFTSSWTNGYAAP